MGTLDFFDHSPQAKLAIQPSNRFVSKFGVSIHAYLTLEFLRRATRLGDNLNSEVGSMQTPWITQRCALGLHAS